MDFALRRPHRGAARAAASTSWTQHVYPAEAVHAEQVAGAGDPWARPPVMAELKAEARERGLWNLFLPDPRTAPG